MNRPENHAKFASLKKVLNKNHKHEIQLFNQLAPSEKNETTPTHNNPKRNGRTPGTPAEQSELSQSHKRPRRPPVSVTHRRRPTLFFEPPKPSGFSPVPKKTLRSRSPIWPIIATGGSGVVPDPHPTHRTSRTRTTLLIPNATTTNLRD